MKRILLLTTLFAGVAAAQPAPPASAPTAPSAAAEMGQPGHFAIDGAFTLAFEHDSASPPQGSSETTTTITIAPSADYFVAPNVSIGASLELLRASTPSGDPQAPGDVTVTGLGAGPRVGYLLALGGQLGLWPRLSVLYVHASLSSPGSSDVTSSIFSLAATAPIVFYPTPHFFVGIGPALRYDLSSKQSSNNMDVDGNKHTVIALQSTVGGWF